MTSNGNTNIDASLKSDSANKSETGLKRTVLCYGDSNTWGYIPGTEMQRYSAHVRWPGVLSKLLGNEYRVQEEGLNGRTVASDDPLGGEVIRNGYRTLPAIMQSHAPISVVVFMLGTNDLKPRFSMPASDIAAGVRMLTEKARNPAWGPGFTTSPEVIVICPPHIWEVEANFGAEFKGGREKSLDFRKSFALMAKTTPTTVIYAEDFIHSDPADGIHLSAESHGVLGQEVARLILEKQRTSGGTRISGRFSSAEEKKTK